MLKILAINGSENNNFNNNPTWKKIERRIQTRRAILESNRKINYNKTKEDLDRVWKREKDFTQILFKSIIPIEIEFDKDLKKKFEDFLPIKFKMTDIFNDYESEEDEKETDVEILEEIDRLDLDK